MPESIPSQDQFKVETQFIEEEEVFEDEKANEFGHGNGNFLTAYFNVVCVVAGTGTLGLPKAFAQGGWLGILILLLAYTMSVYSGIVLIRCLYYKPGSRLHDFKQIGVAAFGPVGYIVSSILHLLNLFGCPALYLVLASNNMVSLLQNYSSASAISYKVWTIIWGVFLVLPSLIMKTLKEVTWVAATGALCTMIAVFVVVIEGPLTRSQSAAIVQHDSVIWSGFPVALSTIAFSFGGNNTYPHVEHALRKPHQWKYAVAAGLSTCTALYFLTAVPGYWSFGRDTQSPIYNSLPSGSIGQVLSMIVMTIHVILAIPIYTTSFSLEFEKFVDATDGRLGKVGAWFARAAIRISTMVILVILAAFIPFFDDFMGLIGALANCGLVFLLPILCYLKLTGVRNKPYYELAFCALTLFLGIIGCVFGTIDSVKALVRDFQH